MFMTQIDDMETLRTAHEDDLRKAGLKMGDIIKIRKLLESDVASQNTGDIFNSSLSSAESENEASKPIQQTLVKQVRIFPPKCYCWRICQLYDPLWVEFDTLN